MPVNRIAGALAEHSLLVFPGQSLDPVTMETFGEYFGPVLAPSWVTKANFAAENQKVFVLSSSPDRMRYAGATWHLEIRSRKSRQISPG